MSDVCAALRYGVDDGQRHQYVAYQPTTEERAAQGVPEEMSKYPINGVEMTVHVGRGLNLTFDEYSLEMGAPEHKFEYGRSQLGLGSGISFMHRSQMASVRGAITPALQTCFIRR